MLNLGCGLGRHSILFDKKNFDATCFDISEDAVTKTRTWARKENLKLDCQVGDMLKLLYPNNRFSAIICYHVINHTDTAGSKHIPLKIHRVLRPSGECYYPTVRESWHYHVLARK